MQCRKSHSILLEYLAKQQKSPPDPIPQEEEEQENEIEEQIQLVESVELEPSPPSHSQVENQFVQFIHLDCDDSFAPSGSVVGEYGNFLVEQSTAIDIDPNIVVGVVGNQITTSLVVLPSTPPLPDSDDEDNDNNTLQSADHSVHDEGVNEDAEDENSAAEEEESEMPDTNDIYGEVLDELNSIADAAAVAQSVNNVTPTTAGCVNNFLLESHSPASLPTVTTIPTTTTATREMEIIESEPPEFACDLCAMTYWKSVALTKHRTLAHPPGHQQSECDVCGKTFPTQKTIRRHMKTHLKLKPHTCPTCGVAFADISNLAQHMRIHKKDSRPSEPVECEQCGKQFKYSTSLNKHMKYHTGRNLYKCVVCERAFSEAKGLRMHQLTHSQETPFGCATCGQRFRHEVNLKRHMRIHDSAKPFSCGVCGKSFRQSTHVRKHMKVHDREKKMETGKKSKKKGGDKAEEFVRSESENTTAISLLRDELLADMEDRVERQHEMDKAQEASERRTFEIG